MTTNDKGMRVSPSQADLAKFDKPPAAAAPAAPVMTPEFLEAINQAVQKATAPAVEPEKPKKNIPKNLFSGHTAHLDVFAPDGRLVTEAYPQYVFYWFLDEGAGQRIAQAKASGWQMVNRNEVLVNDAIVSGGNTDPGVNVRVTYGMWSNGKGKDHYLMKKDKELAREHDMDRERVHQGIEAQLQAGMIGNDANEKRYTAAGNPWAPNSATSLPPIRLNQNRSS